MGHDAVADLDAEFETALGPGPFSEGRQQIRHAEGAFQRAADGEEAPAAEPVHVFMDQAGKPGDLAQQNPHCGGGVLAYESVLVPGPTSPFRERSRTATPVTMPVWSHCGWSATAG